LCFREPACVACAGQAQKLRGNAEVALADSNSGLGTGTCMEQKRQSKTTTGRNSETLQGEMEIGRWNVGRWVRWMDKCDGMGAQIWVTGLGGHAGSFEQSVSHWWRERHES
jgi:hypothetical protein